MAHQRIWAALRQWTFPPPFRISPRGLEGPGGIFAALLSVLSAERAETHQQLDAVAKKVNEILQSLNQEPQCSANSLSPSFAKALCNHCHRLDLNIEQMNTENLNHKELKSNARALDRIREALKTHHIEYRNLSGQIYADTRGDFEPLGPAQPQPGLDRKTIIRCDRPVVFLDGKLIQRASGIVGRPEQEGDRS